MIKFTPVRARVGSCRPLVAGHGLAPLILLALATSLAWSQSAKDTEWPTYGADLRNTHYRPLDQIDASNFSTTGGSVPGGSRRN